MVRSPALEVISYLKKTDDRKPAVRYLFCILQSYYACFFYPHKTFVCLDIYFRWIAGQWENNVSLSRCTLLLHTGMAGVARSWLWVLTLSHLSAVPVLLLQYYIVCLCAAHIWVKNCKELLPSSYNKARFDQPLQANEWLRNFRTTNANFLLTVVIVFAFGGCILWLSNVTQYIFFKVYNVEKVKLYQICQCLIRL